MAVWNAEGCHASIALAAMSNDESAAQRGVGRVPNRPTHARLRYPSHDFSLLSSRSPNNALASLSCRIVSCCPDNEIDSWRHTASTKASPTPASSPVGVIGSACEIPPSNSKTTAAPSSSSDTAIHPSAYRKDSAPWRASKRRRPAIRCHLARQARTAPRRCSFGFSSPNAPNPRATRPRAHGTCHALTHRQRRDCIFPPSGAYAHELSNLELSPADHLRTASRPRRSMCRPSSQDRGTGKYDVPSAAASWTRVSPRARARRARADVARWIRSRVSR